MRRAQATKPALQQWKLLTNKTLHFVWLSNPGVLAGVFLFCGKGWVSCKIDVIFVGSYRIKLEVSNLSGSNKGAHCMAKTGGSPGKPLFQKLGFKPGHRVLLRNPPPQYETLLRGAEGVGFYDTVVGEPFDAMHWFLTDPVIPTTDIKQSLDRLPKGGMLWLSWAKKSSLLFNGVTEDHLRSAILPLGWVDTKVCAVDADWSGLKFLKRKAK